MRIHLLTKQERHGTIILEYWKYGQDYKIYAEEKAERDYLLKLPLAQASAKYYNNLGRLVGMDFIIRQSKFHFTCKQMIKCGLKNIKKLSY